MYNITLISSFHLENGKCNPSELYEIIEDLKPDVIFEELSTIGFGNIYSNNREPKTIEPKAIKKYLNKNRAKHFPVDTFKRKKDDLFRHAHVIEKMNPEYSQVFKMNISLIAENGFSYINSKACQDNLEKINLLEENTLSEMNNPSLSLQYKKEQTMHFNREVEMIKNIYTLSELNPYSSALFICGAIHRNPLKRIISEYHVPGKLNWAFYEGDEN